MHLKGRFTINLVVLVVILLFEDEKFLVREADVFVPVLSVPLEETLCSCLSDLLKAGVRCPFERRCALMCRSSLIRHNLLGSVCSALGT
jgi:hypothetical protein